MTRTSSPWAPPPPRKPPKVKRDPMCGCTCSCHLLLTKGCRNEPQWIPEHKVWGCEQCLVMCRG